MRLAAERQTLIGRHDTGVLPSDYGIDLNECPKTSNEMNRQSIIGATATLLLTGAIVACTSLRHQARAVPKIAKPTEPITEFGFDGDDNELAVAVEKLLNDLGVRAEILSTPQVRVQRGDREYTYDEVQTRYVLRVRSEDLDKCVPEGSRQMHFNISVVDFQERTRVFLMNGEFGCKDTLVRSFASWLSSKAASPR